MNKRLFVYVFLLVTVTSVSATIPEPISFWNFDTGYADSIGTYNWTNSGVTLTTGLIGNATDYTSGDYLSNSAGSSFSPGTSDFTFSFWLKTNSVTNGFILDAYTIAGDAKGFYIYYVGDKIRLSVDDDGTGAYQIVASTTSVDDNVWHHAVLVREGTNIQIFIDGISEANATLSSVFDINFTDAVVLGSRKEGSTYDLPYVGLLDAIGYWKQALTPSQISELYNSASGEQYPFSPPPPPVNTTYVNLTAVDAYDGTALNEFNGTAFLGSNYNRTAVGAVNTWVFDEEVEYYHFTPAVADAVTVATPAGCVLPSTLRKDGGDFDCQGSFGTWIKVRDFGESAVGVQGLYNQGSYSTTNGTIVTTIDEDTQTNGTGPGGGEVANAYVLFEVEAENYYDNNSATFLANTGTTEASLAQGFVYFTCYELYTEDGLGCETGDLPQPRKAGSYTDQINVTDYFPVEYSYNVTALTTVFHDVYGFFDYNLTVSANDYAGNPEANFSINLYNENLSLNQSDLATGSSITYSLLSAYTYAVVLNATSTIYGDPVNQIGYANISIVGTPPASESYQFNLSAARPVFVTLYYEENLTLFENPANLTLTPLSDSSEIFISTSTSNGTANFYNIPVAEYRLRVSSPGYHDEDRYFILSTYTGQNLTAYFRENTTGTAKEFNVVDERNILQNGWIIRFQRYYNDTGWITVDEARSNIDGLAVENVLSDEYYRLILLNEGLVEEYRSERTLLLQDTYQISSDVDTITNTQINKVLGVSAIVYMYPNLDRVEAIGTSSSGTRDWKLELYRTYTDGPVLINSTTASGDSVNLSLYLPNATGNYYAVLSIMGSEIQIAANNLFVGGGPAAIGISGAFYSFVLLLGIVGLAVFSAPAAIVLSIFAVIIASITGLFYVGLNAIVGLAIVGGMIIFRRNT